MAARLVQPYNVSYGQTPVEINDTIDLELQYLNNLRDHFRTATGILAPSIALIGICGNLLSIAVLTRRWLRSSTNCYLTVLAAYDILYLCFGSFLMMRFLADLNRNEVYIRVFWIGRPFTNVFSNTATWLTVTFTVERYVGVSSPIKGRALCTVERAKCIISGVCVAAFLCTLPDFFEYALVRRLIGPEGSNTTVLTIGSTPAYEFLQEVGYYWFQSLMFTFIPLLLLIIFNSLLIKSVMEASKFRRQNASTDSSDQRRERQQREQQKITTMLIAIVLVFLTCQLPSAIMLVISKVYETTSNHERTRRQMTGAVFNLLIMVNSSFNFILYSLFSTKFRTTFRRLFCKCLDDQTTEQLFSEIQPQRGARPSVILRTSPNNSATPVTDRLSKNGYLQIGSKQDESV